MAERWQKGTAFLVRVVLTSRTFVLSQ